MRASSTVRRAMAAGVVGILAAGLLAVPTSAWAAWPTHPDGMRSTSTSTSLTVTSGHSKNATTYRLYASTVYADVWVSNLASGTHSAALRWASSKTSKVTIRGLAYSTKTWYFRMEAISATRERSYSTDVGTTGLRPAAPTGFAVHSSSAGTYLTWSGATSSGFDVQQATDAAMKHGLVTYHVRAYRSAAQQFTPPTRVSGRTYYWRVRSWNNGSASLWTTPAGRTVVTQFGAVRMMTYNLLNLDNATEPDGTPIAPWSQRVAGAAALVAQGAPAVLGVEEGAQWVDTYRTQRQVQSLIAHVNALGHHYVIADTTRARTSDVAGQYAGNFIAYDASVVHPVGTGGFWTLDDLTSSGHSAVFQAFAVNDTNLRFLFVVTHMPNGNIDVTRRNETAAMIRYAHAEAVGRPVVYAGDYNSYPEYTQHPLDGPQVAMGAAHVVDDKTVALHKANAKYNSINEYHDPAPTFGTDIDYLWLSPGVAGVSWAVELDVDKDGRFVGTIPSDHNPVVGTVEIPF